MDLLNMTNRAQILSSQSFKIWWFIRGMKLANNATFQHNISKIMSASPAWGVNTTNKVVYCHWYCYFHNTQFPYAENALNLAIMHSGLMKKSLSKLLQSSLIKLIKPNLEQIL